MKRKLLFVSCALLCMLSGYSQLLYSSSTDLTGAGVNAGLGTNGTPLIIMDDIQIESSRIGTSDSVAVTLMKFGIYREAGAPATTARFYVSPFEDTATTLKDVFKVPTLLGGIQFPANTTTSPQIYTIRLGDSVNALFKIKADTGNLLEGYQTLFAGVSFSEDEGTYWLGADGGSLDLMWVYDADAAMNSRRSLTKFNGNPAPESSLFLQVFGYGIEKVLPVNLISFTAIANANDNVLNWSTGSELNNKGFYIERSIDGESFASIGFVAAANNNTQGAGYTFVDKAPLSVTSFYRLRQIDLTGQQSFSAVVKLAADKIAWEVFPNPTQGPINVSLNLISSSQVSLQLIGMDGKVYQTLNKGSLQSGNHRLTLTVPVKGLYRLRLKVGGKIYYKTISRL